MKRYEYRSIETASLSIGHAFPGPIRPLDLINDGWRLMAPPNLVSTSLDDGRRRYMWWFEREVPPVQKHEHKPGFDSHGNPVLFYKDDS